MTGGEFRRIRRHLGYSARQLGALLGLKDRTIYRYEHEDRAIPRAVEIALKAIQANPPEPPARPPRAAVG